VAYVQFVVNGMTQVLHEDSVRLDPDPSLPRHPYDWKVVLDSAGKVVVRAHRAVIAIAVWRDGAIRDPQGSIDTGGWAMIERFLRPLVDRAMAKGAYFIDPGVLPPLPPPDQAPPPPLAAAPQPVAAAAAATLRPLRCCTAGSASITPISSMRSSAASAIARTSSSSIMWATARPRCRPAVRVP
jgi:hypothetical protein